MFNPTDHLINVRGGQYLPVAPRICLMRQSQPNWSIITEPTQFGETGLVKATILDENGRIIATGHKTITSFRGFDIEKAETGAIGRALSVAGFGTLQAGDIDEADQIADSPVDTKSRSFKKLHALGREIYANEWDKTRPEIIKWKTNGRTDSSTEITTTELQSLIKGLEKKSASASKVKLFEWESEEELEEALWGVKEELADFNALAFG